MRQIVILEHDWPERHWDLFIEDGDVLRAWRIPPEVDWTQAIPAKTNAPHRKAYLTYEGPVSGGRGAVRRVLSGRCEIISDQAEEVILSVLSPVYTGKLVLKLTSGA